MSISLRPLKKIWEVLGGESQLCHKKERNVFALYFTVHALTLHLLAKVLGNIW